MGSAYDGDALGYFYGTGSFVGFPRKNGEKALFVV